MLIGSRSNFELPDAGKFGAGLWRRWIDTSLDSPSDIADWERAPLVSGQTYPTGPRSTGAEFSSVRQLKLTFI